MGSIFREGHAAWDEDSQISPRTSIILTVAPGTMRLGSGWFSLNSPAHPSFSKFHLCLSYIMDYCRKRDIKVSLWMKITRSDYFFLMTANSIINDDLMLARWNLNVVLT